MTTRASATAFAPATCANVAVGFDLLGFAFPVLGDLVTVRRAEGPGITIEAVSSRGGVGGLEAGSLPREPERNTATVGILALLRDEAPALGLRVSVDKGIPLGSGLGGSAASAVAGIVAANALLPRPLPREALLGYAVLGEAVASGAAHADNVAPCLFGGLTLAHPREGGGLEVVPVRVPEGVLCVLVHPHLRLDTRAARAVLRREVALADHVRQAGHLAGFLAGCYTGDLGLVGRSLVDVLIEPQRAGLVPGFAEAKRAALAAGALGCSISGAGPSVFAWASSTAVAEAIRASVTQAFASAGLAADAWIGPVGLEGARLVEDDG